MSQEFSGWNQREICLQVAQSGHREGIYYRTGHVNAGESARRSVGVVNLKRRIGNNA